MTRFPAALLKTFALVAALTGAQAAGAQTPDSPRPVFDLTGAAVETAERACFGPTGQPVPCRRPVVLR